MHNSKISTKKWTLLSTITITSFLMTFIASSVTIALPSIGEDFNCNAVILGWIITSYLLFLAAFLVPMGRISDIKGRKKIFLLGILLYTFSSFLAAISFSAEFLISTRVI